jgi:hypothetical protein
MMVLKRRLLLGARSGEWFFVNPPQQGRKLGVMAIRQLVRKEHLCDRTNAYKNWMTESQLTIQPSTNTLKGSARRQFGLRQTGRPWSSAALIAACIREICACAANVFSSRSEVPCRSGRGCAAAPNEHS